MSLVFSPHQRWISELELNLGLGIVQKVENRRVEIYFPAADCTRTYSIASAPLKRVEFKPGDTIESRTGEVFLITSLTTRNNITIYNGDNIELPESDLKDTLNFSSPFDRFHHRLFDPTRSFDLRLQSLEFYYKIRKSTTRGFIGPRIDLIDHQLYIADRISSQLFPRALLSDETGLGKTIEACLILHRLLLTGRIKRILILVPDSLLLQWFIELLRRFNLVFQIIDKEFTDSKTGSDYTGNLFLEEQLCLCSINYLSSDKELSSLALDSTWDMLVVDEAHHLVSESTRYNLVKELGRISAGMLLLTATPEQSGYQSHYDRLHLLDPDRYYSFEIFLKEEEQYLAVSIALEKLLNGKNPDVPELKLLNIQADEIQKITKNKILSEDLLDRFGPGRAIFQNTRKVITGFPDREVQLINLPGDPLILESSSHEFYTGINQTSNGIQIDYKPDFKNDPRIPWLVQLLKDNSSEKILCICCSKEKAIALDYSIRAVLQIETTLFHEDLTLLQRDQNASRFANENGARILICSEIGSEGRNFQFAHHLVLFDLPVNPELLEQRIGRLDRIGQKETIIIHVPFIAKSEYEFLARWFHEGFNLFRENFPGVYGIFKTLEDKLKSIIEEKDHSGLEKLIQETKAMCRASLEKNTRGKDHLLALNSFQPEVAKKIKTRIKEADSSPETEDFMHRVFEHFGIEEDYISDKTYKLDLSLITNDTFPLPVVDRNNIIITFDRSTALSHENYEFINPDHPMVNDTLEFLLASESGNCSIATLPGIKGPMIILETIYILECLAPPSLHADRYLPPTPIRSLVNHLKADCENEFLSNYFFTNLKDCHFPDIINNSQFKDELLPAMIQKSQSITEEKCITIQRQAADTAEKELNKEIHRRIKLKELNANINPEEIRLYSSKKEALAEAIL